MNHHRSRAAVGAALFAAALAGLATVASAKDGPHQCVTQARSARRACNQGCADAFQSDFAACFGAGGSCAANCITAQLSCEATPLDTLHHCASDVGNPSSCRSVREAAAQACKSDPDPPACNDEAELAALKCRQACVDEVQPQLDDCHDAFRLCVQGCAGTPTTTTTLP